MTPSALLEVRGLAVAYSHRDSIVEAIRDVSFSVQRGEFVSLVGPSGSGKSTLLNAIASFIPASSGSILVNGHAIVDPAVSRGFVFQSHALFPWLTVIDNVTFGPRMRGARGGELSHLAAKYTAMVGLTHLEKRYPSQLSGGQQQRVALARAIANEPELLLMDEPFGELDALSRLQLQIALLDVWDKLNLTILFVTHDVDEALFLSDRVLIMSSEPGPIAQECPVPLSRPRHLKMKALPEFNSLRTHVLRRLGLEM